MAKKQGKRQGIRKALLLISLLSFPAIINYLSPYVIIDGASQGIVNGSFVVFISLFVTSLFVGRLWCGWLCPGAGLEEACIAVNDRPARGGRWNWIKWVIWFVWIGFTAYLVLVMALFLLTGVVVWRVAAKGPELVPAPSPAAARSTALP